MRDFRDAKAMAHSLRDALKVKAVETTHSECLELIAKVFGYENWNILSAKIDAARSSASDADASATTVPKPDKTLYCTFCGKSQHEVKTLIAGPPPTFVCNECVSLCNDVLDDEEILSLLKADDERGNQSYPTAFEYVRSKSTEQLISKVERAKKGAETWRFGLQQLKRKLAMREGEVPAEGDVLTSPGFAYLQNKKRDDLLAFQRHHEQALKRYEVAQRIVTTVLGERGQ